ncbi:MAG: hypothetical protein FJY95_16035 [Candidatus Handelsmanbacteria bacterium]|nr:hypothetical protein [Candidatus Handelsmanbacteria bacterium]
MPLHEPDATDPMVFVGVTLPGDLEATREMAYVFAEEFARLGHPAARIMDLFRKPFYQGAHQAFLALEEEEIGRIVAECVGLWGRFAWVDQDQGVDPDEEQDRREMELLEIEMPQPAQRGGE